jgi:RimJ/RimL family protein N-acetyltransferase
MNAIPVIETERLVMRPFRNDDLVPYTHRLFADAEVMRYLPKRADEMPCARADRTMKYFNAHWHEFGYGAWAVTDQADGQLIGHCGLN